MPTTKQQGSPLEAAVSRALRDNLVPLQRTVEDLQQSYADLVAACASTRPSNTLPALVRAQSASAALSAALSVLSNFVTIALQPGARGTFASEVEELPLEDKLATEMPDASPAPHIARPAAEETLPEDGSGSDAIFAPENQESDTIVELPADEAAPVPVEPQPVPVETAAPGFAELVQTASSDSHSTFELAALAPELQELHKRANRVAKVAMQDIKLLRPKDVRLGLENKDICDRLRVDLDKARKEYDRRFRPILDHPVDYFHEWMVAILADGNVEALGKYPYPSPVLHQ